jgi:hypothetical protein
MPNQKLTIEILVAAMEGFEAQKRRIDERIAEVRRMLEGGLTDRVAAPEAPKGKRRKMSAAARKRVGDAQRKRRAESKGEAESGASPAGAKPKRKLSAAGRAAIVAALKKRWAAKKAAPVKATPGVRKKTAAKKVVAAKATTPAIKRPQTGAAQA